jgi:hypothetical protein
MKRTRRAMNWMIVGGVAATALVIATSSATAQDTTTSTTSTTDTSTSTTTTRAPHTTATPQMIEEAIQRSHARSEKLRTLGRPEQWGSEEPFVFNPSR